MKYKYRISFEIEIPYEDVDDSIYRAIISEANISHIENSMTYIAKSLDEKDPEMKTMYEDISKHNSGWSKILNNIENYESKLLTKT